MLEIFSSTEALVRGLQPTEPVFCLRPDKLRKAAERFISGFPGKVLYAVKANPNPEVISALYAAGIRSFDTASLREIELVKGLFPDAECYFMAICKLIGAAEKASVEFGICHFVADHLSEVKRLLELSTPDTTIHIRMKTFDSASVYELSSKFGAVESDVIAMLRYVAEAGYRVGLAFNIGSLCRHPDAYRRAINVAGQVIKESGVEVVSLDVGGGFPVDYPGFDAPQVESFFDAVKDESQKVDLPENCILLCEPGRALVAEGQTLLTQVILLKDDLVFLNDGIYGGFKELDISNDYVRFPPKVICLDGVPDTTTRPYSVSGPTCDSLDIFPKKIDLPINLKVGDWIEFSLAGAYSNSMATRFNGFYTDKWVRIEENHDTDS